MLLAVVQFLTLGAAVAGGALFALVMRGPERLRGLAPLAVWLLGYPVLPYVYVAVFAGDSEGVMIVAMVAAQLAAGALGVQMGIRALKTHLERAVKRP